MPRTSTLEVKQQQRAGKLYLSGLSARQIADTFKVSLDAVYYALRNQDIERRSASETNRIRFEAKPLSFKIKKNLTSDEERLKQAAVLLYWAEGYKAGDNSVDFANSDPDMIRIFWKFLLQICRVDQKRTRLHLYAYEGQNIPKLIRYWSRLLKTSGNKFVKPYIKKGTSGPRGPRMIHGLVHIRYGDKKLLRQILSWIDEYRQKMLR